jgi:arginine-tRNA-protein transferase
VLQPNNRRTCCQQYTIRLPVLSFTPTRNQRRLLKRWDDFLAGEP